MRYARRYCATAILMVALSSVTFADGVLMGDRPPPPPPPPAVGSIQNDNTAPADGIIQTGSLTETVLSMLGNVLALF